MVEAKMERQETSTSNIGPEFSTDFRQELADADVETRLSICLLRGVTRSCLADVELVRQLPTRMGN